MYSLLFVFVFLISCGKYTSLIMHFKGPTHRKMAESCLEGIVREHFNFQHGESNETHTMLVAVVVTDNMDSPAYEIQQNMIRKIHDMADSYQVEILSPGDRFEFQSYENCYVEENCQKSFIIDFKPNIYVIIIDDQEKLDVLLEMLEDTKTFNPNAIFLVYVEYNGLKYSETAKETLVKMWSRMLGNAAVLIPRTLQEFSFYKLDTATRGPYQCGTNLTLDEIDQCVKGNMLDIKKQYFKVDQTRDHLNCSVGVISPPYKPFVINETHGFEIELLRSISSIINVHFNINICENLTDNWGSQENGVWSGKLKVVYEDYYLGVGNIETGMSYAVDFTFSEFYHMEPLVFVVPIARYVPKWRVLVAIFTPEMWGICGGIIICFAIGFYFVSKLGNEIEHFKSLSNCIYLSFQVIIYHSVPKQPVTDFTRVVFLGLAIISIIIASAYACSLVYYLKNPIREHQPTTESDFADNFGNYKFGLGGISRYKELFSSANYKKLLEIYQTADGENDTILYWIGNVAQDRDIWTISSRFYANYLLASDNNVTVDQWGKPNIYVFKEQIMSYSICIIMRKGHPLLSNINYAIQRLSWGGFVDEMASKYVSAIEKKISTVTDDDDTYAPLGIDNLQGAFAMLMLGCLLGFVSLCFECLIKIFKDMKSKTA